MPSYPETVQSVPDVHTEVTVRAFSLTLSRNNCPPSSSVDEADDVVEAPFTAEAATERLLEADTPKDLTPCCVRLLDSKTARHPPERVAMERRGH
jgi:hypothetical protein